jgi:hypothetical protein
MTRLTQPDRLQRRFRFYRERKNHVRQCFSTRVKSQSQVVISTQLDTHIDSAFLISSFFILSKYFANRMPAGHSMPPHPSARSSWSSSGGSSKPPKSTVLMLAATRSGASTKSSPKPRKSCSGDGEREAIVEGDMISIRYVCD